MKNFEVGSRVRVKNVLRSESLNGVKPGDKGTVLYQCGPTVKLEMDEYNPLLEDAIGLSDIGYGLCINAGQLESIEEAVTATNREILLEMYEKLWNADKDKWSWYAIVKDSLEKLQTNNDTE